MNVKGTEEKTTLKTVDDLFKSPEIKEIEKRIDSGDVGPGYITVRGKKKYILMSGVLGCWNDVVHERKVLAKRRRKNQLARITRKQQRAAAKKLKMAKRKFIDKKMGKSE